MVKALPMRNLFGDAGIRLVAYEFPHSAIARNNSPKHPKADLKYVFNLTLNPIDPASYEGMHYKFHKYRIRHILP